MDNKNIDQQLQEALETNAALSQEVRQVQKRANPTNLKKGMRQKSILGAILLLILVLTGTFAWQSYQQRAINPFYDPSGNHGVRFHDRLQLDTTRVDDTTGDYLGFPFIDPTQPTNLNIFAENFGDMDVFVRIQLREFFALDNDDYGFGPSPVAGSEVYRNDPNTWPIFRTAAPNINVVRYNTPSRDIYHEGVRVNLGQDNSIAFMPTFNRAVQLVDPLDVGTHIDGNIPAPFQHPNAAMMSEATGAAVDWFTTPTDGDYVAPLVTNHIRQYTELGIPTGPGITDYADAHNLLTAQRRRELDDGSPTAWAVGDELYSRRLYTNNDSGDVELRLSNDGGPADDGIFVHTAQENLDWYVDWTTSSNNSDVTSPDFPTNFRGVMTLTNWNALGRPDGNFWIHDSEDPNGWFYWMGYLEQGTNPEAGIVNATSLLVDSLELPTNPLEWEYALYMNGHAFTRQSLEDLYNLNEITTNALQIFKSILDDTPRPVGGSFTIEGNLEDGFTIEGVSASLTAANMPTTFTVGAGTRAIRLPETVDPNLVNITNNSTWSHRFESRNIGGTYFNYVVLEQALNISAYPSLTPLTDFPTTAHERFIDNETQVVWRVLLPNDGSGNALIITDDVHSVKQHSNDPRSTRTSGAGISAQRNWNRLGINAFSNWYNSDLRIDAQRWLDNTYDNNVSEGLRTRVMPYEFQNNAGATVAMTAPGAGIEALGAARNVEWPAGVDSHLQRTPHPGINHPYNTVTNPTAPAAVLEANLRNPAIVTLTTPAGTWRSNAQATDEEHCQGYTWPFAGCTMRRAFARPQATGTPGTGRAFKLSTSEANTFFSGATGPQGRQTNGVLATTGARTTAGLNWILRSAGDGFTHPGRIVSAAGTFNSGNTYVWNFGALRPATWVAR